MRVCWRDSADLSLPNEETQLRQRRSSLSLIAVRTLIVRHAQGRCEYCHASLMGRCYGAGRLLARLFAGAFVYLHRRMPLIPWHRLLIGIADLEDRSFVKRFACELKTNG